MINDRNVIEDAVKAHNVFADIQIRKKHNLKLPYTSEADLQNMYSEFSAAVYYYDLWGRFQWGNRLAEEICGYHAEEVIGLPYYKTRMVTLSDIVKTTKLTVQCMDLKSVGPIEFNVIRKDTSRRIVDVYAQLLRTDRGIIILCVAIDKTVDRLKKMNTSEESYCHTACMHCNKIRDRKGNWINHRVFLHKVYNILFSHGICPECMDKFYSSLMNDEKNTPGKRYSG